MNTKFNLFTLIQQQKDYFNTDETKSVEFRIKQLKKLKSLIRQYETQILEALQQDLGRSPLESYVAEIMFLINEINYSIKKLRTWAKPQAVNNSFFLYPARSKIYYEPYGVCLIIAPWNYPFILIMRPLISAISAGNCVTLKCSEYAPYTNKVIFEIINQHFAQEYLFALDTGSEGTEQLIRSGYDFILYTGGSQVGKTVMKNAAETLTPLVLELGGKSPVIVDKTADIKHAANRIIWSKLINVGQTCIAPDYVYVHASLKEKLIQALQLQIELFYGKDPLHNPDLGKIINERHFQRLMNLIENSKVIYGGQSDPETLKIAPTLVESNSHQDVIMKDEIFGPILPILSFDNLDMLITHLKNFPKPLSLYYFSKHQNSIRKVNQSLSFGGGCINDCVMQFSNKYLPFGGVGKSGFGAYIGEQGFKTFSHAKPVVERKRMMIVDFLPMYPEYTKAKFKLFTAIAKLIGY